MNAEEETKACASCKAAVPLTRILAGDELKRRVLRRAKARRRRWILGWLAVTMVLTNLGLFLLGYALAPTPCGGSFYSIF
jgi:hypothetical protein